MRPPLPSRTANTAPSMSPRAERSCCQQHILNRWANGRAGRAGRDAAFAQGTIHTGASWMCAGRYSAASSSRITRNRQCCIFQPLGGLFVPIARVKSRSQYEIALVRQRFEPDAAAMLAKSIASRESCFCASEKPIEGLLGALAKITPKFKGIGRFFDG